MSRFDPDFYLRYRPFYPAETFSGLAERLRSRGLGEPYQVVDLGCGTGHSIVSLFRSGVFGSQTVNFVGIDPDPEMLERARILTEKEGMGHVDLRLGIGEGTGLDDSSADVISVGSAFHWMDPAAARREFLRVLKPQGVVRIFEYQFPKAANLPELNEWIRREFNLRWKAPEQKPRGRLRQLAEAFVQGSDLRILAEARPKMELELSAEDLTGLVLSQSRVLHYEETLDGDLARVRFRAVTRDKLEDLMRGEPSARFDFKLAWIELG